MADYHLTFNLDTSDCIHCLEFYEALFAAIRAVIPDCNETLYFGFDESKKRRQLLDYQKPQQLYEMIQIQLDKQLGFKQKPNAIKIEKQNRAWSNKPFPGDYFLRGSVFYILADAKQNLMFFVTVMKSQYSFVENTLGMHLYQKQYQRQDSGLLLSNLFQELTARFPFDYGYVCEDPEFDAAVMHPEGGRRAGPRRSEALDGLFWKTSFGPLFCEHVGREQFEKLECFQKTSNQYGYLLKLSEHYTDWTLPEYLAAKQRIEKQLGIELFFNRNDPERVYAVPPLRKPTVF